MSRSRDCWAADRGYVKEVRGFIRWKIAGPPARFKQGNTPSFVCPKTRHILEFPIDVVFPGMYIKRLCTDREVGFSRHNGARLENVMRSQMVKTVAIAVAFLSILGRGYCVEGWRPWTFSVEGYGIFDDNRDGTDSDKESQFQFRVSPRGDLKGSVDRTDFDVFYTPTISYRSNPRIDQNQSDLYHDLGIDVHHRYSERLRFDFREFFHSTDVPSVMDSGRTFRETVNYQLNRVRFGAGYELIPNRSSINIHGRQMWKMYDSELYSLIGDEEQTGVDVGGKYVTRSGISLLCATSYDDSDIGTQYDVDRSTVIMTAEGGAEKVFSAFTVMGKVGASRVHYDNASYESRTVPSGELQLLFSPSALTRLSLAVHRRVVRGDISPYSTQDRTSVAVAARHEIIPKRMMASLRAVYARGDYQGGTVALYENGSPVATLPDGNDTLLAFEGGLDYVLNRNLSASASYGYEKWDADPEWIRTPHARNTFRFAVKSQF